MPPDTSQVTRIQWETRQHTLDEIAGLMKDCGIETRKDYLNNAITLLKWAIAQTKAGYSVAAINEKDGTRKELQMPVLSNLSAKTPKGTA